MLVRYRPTIDWSRLGALIALSLLVVAGLAFGIRMLRDANRAEALESWYQRLTETASERSTLVSAWVEECQRDGRAVASFPSVHELLQPRKPGAAAQKAWEDVQAHLAELLTTYIEDQHYEAIQITGASGETLLQVGEAMHAGHIRFVHDRVMAQRTPVVHLFEDPESPHVVFGVPSGVTGQGPAGAVFLVTHAGSWLYPELLREPVPTATGENVLLARTEGGAVAVSPLRHTAATLLPAGVAVTGLPAEVFQRPLRHQARADVFERPLRHEALADYRGVPSIAVTRPIAGTEWALLAKVDWQEVTGPADRRTWEGVAAWMAAGLAFLAFTFAAWRQRQVRFASEQLASAERIGFLNRLLRTISEVHALIIRERDKQALLDGTCRTIVDHGGFQMVWIGQAGLDGRVRPLAAAGHVEGYLDVIDERTDEAAAGTGLAGTAIRERHAVAAHDVETAPEMAASRAFALARGYRSAASFPLICDNRVLGALTVHASEPGVLRDEAVELLASLALDVAYAVQVLENEELHRATMKERARLEEQLQQAQKMEAVGRLAGGVAHDFNNLLTAITGYAELALSEADDPERCKSDIEEIRRAGERAGELTRQLLAFSRKQVLQPRVLDLNDVVRDVEKMLRRLIGENIQFALTLAPNLGRVKADPGQLEQVLMNLSVNARDAMPSGGRVFIETSNVTVGGERWRISDLEPGRYVKLSFRDSGAGISADVLPYIFEPFFTTKERGKGTGLGLSTVYGIVKQSGGTITVDSLPGSGTTFEIYLPRADAAELPTTTSETMELAGKGRGETVLVVEDNDAVRTLVCEGLRRAGYHVVEASSAEQAMALLTVRNGPVHLLLTDVVLPRMTGPDLAKQALAARPELKLLFMSGYTDDHLAPGTFDMEVGLITKPFTPASIAARVAEVLGGRG